MHITIKIRVLLFVILLFWTAGIFFTGFLNLHNNLIIFYPFVKKLYSVVCHQDQLKLVDAFGGTTLVCARCTGIYIGLVITSLIFVLRSFIKVREIKYLLASSVPIFIDVLFVNIGFYEYSKPLAFITGILFGSVLFLYFYNALILLFIEIYPQGLK